MAHIDENDITWLQDGDRVSAENTNSPLKQFLQKLNTILTKTITTDETSISPVADTVVIRDDDGNFTVNEPTNNNHPATKAYADSLVGELVSVTGFATLDSPENKITLTGVGLIGLELGDVIEISGSSVQKNNDLFTVSEVIDNDNIIVNEYFATEMLQTNVVQTNRRWLCINNIDGELFATDYGGFIYKFNESTRKLEPWMEVVKNWTCIIGVGTAKYAIIEKDGVYKLGFGDISFTKITTGNVDFRRLFEYNGDVYAIVNGGKLWKQTGASGTFVEFTDCTARGFTGLTSHNGDIYACVHGGYIYKWNGTDFDQVSNTKANWYDIKSLNGKIYVVSRGGSLYTLDITTGVVTSTGNGNASWASITAASDRTIYAVIDGGSMYSNEPISSTKRLWNYDGNATVKLVAKWHSASPGIGQIWVRIDSNSIYYKSNHNFTNTTGRPLQILVSGQRYAHNNVWVDDLNVAYFGTDDDGGSTLSVLVPRGSTFRWEAINWGRTVSMLL